MRQNYFFRQAYNQSSENFNRNRVLRLIAQMSRYLSSGKWSSGRLLRMKTKVETLVRLLKASVTGRYHSVSTQSLVLIMASLIYFINPMDLIPDMVPLTGFTDDFGILMMVYSIVEKEVEKFKEWENFITKKER